MEGRRSGFKQLTSCVILDTLLSFFEPLFLSPSISRRNNELPHSVWLLCGPMGKPHPSGARDWGLACAWPAEATQGTVVFLSLNFRGVLPDKLHLCPHSWNSSDLSPAQPTHHDVPSVRAGFDHLCDLGQMYCLYDLRFSFVKRWSASSF